MPCLKRLIANQECFVDKPKYSNKTKCGRASFDDDGGSFSSFLFDSWEASVHL